VQLHAVHLGGRDQAAAAKSATEPQATTANEAKSAGRHVTAPRWQAVTDHGRRTLGHRHSSTPLQATIYVFPCRFNDMTAAVLHPDGIVDQGLAKNP
jgi:hypothetical protein